MKSAKAHTLLGLLVVNASYRLVLTTHTLAFKYVFFQLDNDEQPKEMLSTESPSKDIGNGLVEVAMEVDENDYAIPSSRTRPRVSPEQLSFIFNDYCGTSSSQIPKFVNKEVQTDICKKTYSDASTQVEFNYTNPSMQTTFIETKLIGLQVQKQT